MLRPFRLLLNFLPYHPKGFDLGFIRSPVAGDACFHSSRRSAENLGERAPAVDHVVLVERRVSGVLTCVIRA